MVFPGFRLTGASVSGKAGGQGPAPGFYGNGVKSPRCQRREDTLDVSGRDTFILQNAVVVADQNDVSVQISCCATPGHLNTTHDIF